MSVMEMLEENSIDKNMTVYAFEVFDTRDLVNFVAYAAMTLIGMLLNSWVLVTARRQDSRCRTNLHYLVFHLTIADTIVCFITMPMETIWRATIGWYAGNLLCKALMMVRAGGYILSSNMLVVLSIDRLISIIRPLSALNTVGQRKRARLMVMMSWLATIIFTLPQAIIFRVLKHPEKEFYQCTTYNFFEDLSSPVQIGNTTQLYLAGLTPIQVADLYHTIFNCEVFFVPAIVIVACYTKIYSVLLRENKQLLSGTQETQNPAERISNQKKKKKSIMKALKMSVIHAVVFVLCWTPYSAMATWDTLAKESARQVPGHVQDFLYLTAVFNICVNPLIYGVYYYSESKARPTHSSSGCNVPSPSYSGGLELTRSSWSLGGQALEEST